MVRSDVIVIWGVVRYAQHVTEFMVKEVHSDGHASQVNHWKVFRTYRQITHTRTCRQVMKKILRGIRYTLNKDYVENAHNRVRDHDIDIDVDID